ncbi:hypothetical protein L0U85_03545 [Glycomyces sp. L485]|uniref:hypothetical protein n=1 Tax=Glycomyces sp. L485 TaxID=2909235 RepID=UPI001F4B3C85|nr:hypothetical protein [Glycomyces sp. L485]MCH7229936.1 hypothetical protein [Glycomyces sp. L485]
MSFRNYKRGVVEALIAWCQGTCYWPDCERAVIEMVNGRPVFDLETAHICAKKPNGPRHDPSIDPDAFDNLILLCGKHHKEIDKLNPAAYPVDLLRAWKRQREAGGAGPLRELRGLDEDLLQLIIDRHMVPALDKIGSALDHLEQYDVEAAAMLRNILGELEGFKRQHPGLNEGTVSMLYEASKILGAIDEGTIASLRTSTETLDNLPQLVEQLNLAVRAAKNISPYM